MSPILDSIGSVKSYGWGVLIAPLLPSFDAIATTTVGSGGSSTITFSGIPSTYTHLQIRGIARTNGAGTVSGSVGARLNSDSGNNYASHYVGGDGATIASSGFTAQNYVFGIRMAAGSANTGVFGALIFDILDYANTNKYKTLRCLSGADNNGSGQMHFSSGLWESTSSVTSFTLDGRGETFQQYSSFTLYGIKG